MCVCVCARVGGRIVGGGNDYGWGVTVCVWVGGG